MYLRIRERSKLKRKWAEQGLALMEVDLGDLPKDEAKAAEEGLKKMLKAAFDLFDADASGYIDRSELSVMLRKLGFEWQGAHVFEAADVDADGKVDFAEFLALFGKAAKPKARAHAKH